MDDSVILEHLRHGDELARNQALEALCSPQWEALARKAVLAAGGPEMIVEDVFQESLAILANNIMQGKFRGESKLSTYFYTICRRLYLKKYSEKPPPEGEEAWPEEEHAPSADLLLIDQETQARLSQVLDDVFRHLSKTCAQLLTLIKQGLDYQTIAEECNYESKNVVRTQALRCRRQMREFLTANPEWAQLLKSLR
jgi:RNA polymerase sigma factor (sigma-70 family)